MVTFRLRCKDMYDTSTLFRCALLPQSFSLDVGSQCIIYAVSAVLLQNTSVTDNSIFIILTFVIIAILVYETMLPVIPSLVRTEVLTKSCCLCLPYSAQLFWLFCCDDAPELPDTEKSGSTAHNSTSSKDRALATAYFTFYDRRAIFLMALPAALGCAELFWYSYVNDETIDAYISTYAVAYLGAVQSGVIALLAIPAAWFSARFGKTWVLTIGSLSYMCLGGAYLIWTNEELGHWSSGVALAVMYGLGRLTYENSANAIYAGLFTENRAMAFASLNFVMGSFSSIFAFLLASGIDNGTHFNQSPTSTTTFTFEFTLT